MNQGFEPVARSLTNRWVDPEQSRNSRGLLNLFRNFRSAAHARGAQPWMKTLRARSVPHGRLRTDRPEHG